MSPKDKPIVWLHGDVKTPPFSRRARIETGFLLRLLQKGGKLSMPHSKPMPDIGTHCHELRIKDKNAEWRVIYRVDVDAVIIPEVFNKKSRTTPQRIINVCKKRFKEYDAI